MQYFQDVLTLSIEAQGLFDAFDLIGFDDEKIAAADAPVKGVAKNPATEIGLQVGVIAIGTARVRAVGAITPGVRLVSAAAGGVQAADPEEDEHDFATALTTAANGEFVTILIR